MDDVLETPAVLPESTLPQTTPDAPEEEEDGEDDMPDWTRFAPQPSAPAGSSSSSSKPGPAAGKKQIIPQRGDKEFSPSAAGETALQSYALQRARGAMFDALRAGRGSSSKNITHGLWVPRLGRVKVPHPRGQYFTTMGHFLPASEGTIGKEGKGVKQLVLLPEEALYLIERGSMACEREMRVQLRPPRSGEYGGREEGKGAGDGEQGGEAATKAQEEEEAKERVESVLHAVPMSVQQAYAEMLGTEGLTLERYQVRPFSSLSCVTSLRPPLLELTPASQVYAYLRRLGYTVTRAHPPTSPEGALFPRPPARAQPTLWQRLSAHIRRWLVDWSRWGQGAGVRSGNWWAPLRFGWGRWTYRDIFTALRLIPSGHKLPLYAPSNPPSTQSPYEVFFHVWRPSTPWKKTAVPPPDFEVIVVNANTTRIPTLAELANVFDHLPVQPPPPPRKRPPPSAAPPAVTSPPPPSLLTHIKRLLHLTPPPKQKEHKVHPFAALKAGRKSVVLAAVDAGSVSLVRFSEGVFEDWPMV
ncbi:hypothetical protein CALVIDRAFT_539128 [Calocera viscosa TUFC12733]|uniref:tRNA-splicing endonuclease subunit Sen54 N-terminal domain-containing protein n=1 Tax=Calocera viscosa (strain TUFC12733) TaxID=1330018 RepID=A0A167K8U8_CALVF|nr:hypothetical protein CALVIDRAFT_539128 [Calocera viscosa TUFC12733]